MKETEDSKDPRIETIKVCEDREEAENVGELKNIVGAV